MNREVRIDSNGQLASVKEKKSILRGWGVVVWSSIFILMMGWIGLLNIKMKDTLTLGRIEKFLSPQQTIVQRDPHHNQDEFVEINTLGMSTDLEVIERALNRACNRRMVGLAYQFKDPPKQTIDKLKEEIQSIRRGNLKKEKVISIFLESYEVFRDYPSERESYEDLGWVGTKAIIGLMGEIGPTSNAIPFLVERLTRTTSHAEASKALLQISSEDTELIEPLFLGLKETWGDTFDVLTRSLLRIKTPAVISKLKRALAEKDEKTCYVALTMLEKIEASSISSLAPDIFDILARGDGKELGIMSRSHAIALKLLAKLAELPGFDQRINLDKLLKVLSRLLDFDKEKGRFEKKLKEFYHRRREVLERIPEKWKDEVIERPWSWDHKDTIGRLKAILQRLPPEREWIEKIDISLHTYERRDAPPGPRYKGKSIYYEHGKKGELLEGIIGSLEFLKKEESELEREEKDAGYVFSSDTRDIPNSIKSLSSLIQERVDRSNRSLPLLGTSL